MKQPVGACLAMVLGTGLLWADTYYVAATGGSDAAAGTEAAPFATVEKGVQTAQDGDTVVLLAGVHTLATVGNWLLIDKAITVRGHGATAADAVVQPNKSTGVHCFFSVSNALARVANLTFTGAAIVDNGTDAYRQSPFYLWDGVLTNCVIRDNSQANTGTVNQRGGVIDDCLFHVNHSTSAINHWIGSGGALYIAGGVTTNCVFRGNYTRCFGGAIYAYGGLVTDCVVTNNSIERHYGFNICINGGTVRGCLVADGRQTSPNNPGGGVCVVRGVFEQSRVRGNTTPSSAAGVALVKSPAGITPNASVTTQIVQNCVIYGNVAGANGAGVWMDSGCLANCTVSGNTCTGGTGAGVYQTGGAVINSIVFNNSLDNIVTSGGTVIHTCSDTVVEGVGNIAANPLFMNPAAGDFSLRPGSPAIDSGTNLVGIASDFYGVARPRGARFDMGAFERVSGAGDLVCGFTVSEETLAAAGDVILNGFADGADTTGLSFAWDFDNDGVIDDTGSEVTLSVLSPASYSVLLVVTNSAGDRCEYLREDVITFVTYVAYVNPGGSNTSPYETPAKGAHSLQDAVDAVAATDEEPGEVVVMDGTYPCPAPWTTITKPVTVRSQNGPAATILQGWNSGSAAANYRVMLVNHEKAFVSGFTLENGKWDSYVYGDQGCGALRVVAGVVSNCVIRNSNGNDLGGGVNLRGGTITHCVIYGNKAYRSNNVSAGKAGGIYMTGGTLQYSVVSNNIACSADAGCGIRMTGGITRHCLITDNLGNNAAVTGCGVHLAGGTMSECAITGNGVRDVTRSYAGGGVVQAGGTLRNCLIAGNRTSNRAAGVHQTGGTVENCTITANASSAFVGSGLYLAGANAIARNNVIHGNGAGVASEPLCNIEYSSSKSFATNVVVPATSGTANIGLDPLFSDAAGGDYTLGAGSPAIDAAAAIGLTTDLAGNLRPKDGNGDTVPVPDIGCYEAAGVDEGPLRCSFTASVRTGYDGFTTVLNAYVAGEGSQGTLTYDWDFGGGTGPAEPNQAEVEVDYTAYGYHTVRLVVTAASGARATNEVPSLIAVGARKIYLNTTGNGTWPYATAETGTNDLVAALSSALYTEGQLLEVEVDDGDYPINDKWAIITGLVRLYSKNGPHATAFYGANPVAANMRKLLHLNNAAASVAGFTFRNGWWDNYVYADGGGVVRITAGRLSNCIFHDNLGGDDAGAVDLLGGEMTECLFYNNESYRDSNAGGQGKGGAFTVKGAARVSNCVVSNNYVGVTGGGVYLNHADGVVSNCFIVGNWAGRTARYNKTFTSSTHLCGGVRIDAGTLVNCLVADNYAYYDIGGAGVMGANGRMINCLVIRNAGKSAACQGAAMTAAGQIVNCTFAGNGTNEYASGVAVTLAAGTFKNNIVWGNGDCVTELSPGAAAAAYNCFPGAAGANDVSSDPLFKNAACGDYSLQGTSPCRNAGDTALWTGADGTLDLAGNPRVKFGRVDMGCFERITNVGAVLILR